MGPVREGNIHVSRDRDFSGAGARVDGPACWVADYQDPIAFLELFTTGNGNNNTGFGDKEYDTAVDQVRTSADPVARAVLLTRLESILLSRGPIIPIYFYGRPYLLNRQVRGFEPHLLDLHPFKYLSFETTPPVSPPKETP